MEIIIWEGGLQTQEIDAIGKIKKAFSNLSTQSTTSRSGSLQDQLRAKLPNQGMFPWKGYAGFRLVDAKGKEGEFDLVIVTHCNVIIVELKDWNHAPITSLKDNWYKGDKNMGRSPVSVTRNKKFLLDNKIKKIKNRFTNNKYPPFVHFVVVMTGNASFDGLTEQEKEHTISLSDFLKYADEKTFNNKFRPHPEGKELNKDFYIFDEIFGTQKTQPKPIRVHGFEAVDEIFKHPKGVYREFTAISELSRNSEALLRIWDFNKIDGIKGKTADGRLQIVSREYEVLQHINHHDHDLYHHCLRSLTSIQKDDITSEYSEVYELPPSHIRLNEFIGKFCTSFSGLERLKLIKLLIAKFADLHELKIAHRDIGDHSLWISPSKEVALSNFISAYHQPVGTVGDYRTILSVGAVEATDMLDYNSDLSPFQSDIHALGVVSWHLLAAKRITPKSLESIQSDLLDCDEWYGEVILDAIEAKKYLYAGDYFDALKKAEPKNRELPIFDDMELDQYRRSINHSRQFRENDGIFIVETDEKEVYFSNGQLVKAWLNVGTPEIDPLLNLHALRFLNRIQKLVSLNSKYIPTIREFGVASKSSSLFLVTDKVEGITWDMLEIEENKKLFLIETLISSIELLHNHGLAHGDLHPLNVIVNPDVINLKLIDIPDFSSTGEYPKNHKYSPENIDNCSAFERDNFAVMRMSCELLGIEWGKLSERYPHISSVIQCEMNDLQFGFKDLGRFSKVISTSPKRETITLQVVIGGNTPFQEIDILPDNGRLFVKIERNQRSDKEARINFAGIGGNFQTIFNKTSLEFILGFAPQERSGVSRHQIDECQVELNLALKISYGSSNNLSKLSAFLRENEAFQIAVKQKTSVLDDQPPLASINQQLKEEFIKLGTQYTVTNAPVIGIKTHKLWQAILDTETESHPNIEVNSSPLIPDNIDNELILPYDSDFDVLGQFDKTDEIDALLIENDNEKIIGQVLLRKSALNEVRLTNLRRVARGIKEGDIIYFRTRMTQASFKKRKVALERILDGESVIANLGAYFDPSSSDKALDYEINVTESDFARYDRTDDNGNLISLNEQQRLAFIKLLNYGPVSLLQGPPGTGKTEFIAAFVHFLIENQKTERILLVSQSHEAVNTAAERIRKHCSRLDTSLEVVRFSNREGAVSSGLRDVYSQAIMTEQKELFSAEYKYRVGALSDAFGLDAEYLSSTVKAEMRLFKQIDELEKLLNELETPSNHEDDRKQLKVIAAKLDEHIRSTLLSDFSIELSVLENVSKAKDILMSKLNFDHDVRPDQARKARALAKISRDMLTALSGDRVNYDEFFARSRQLVTGTCVGIGQRHIGIAENIYDWVIIDEAARSISSELAIAMQSGKRVLLVGDHLQLPPLYSGAHKKALARKLGIANIAADIDDMLQSDFARAFTSNYGGQTGATLLTQYRMAPPIGNLVSQTFYSGQLRNGARIIPDIYDSAPDKIKSVVTWLDTASLGSKSHHNDDKGMSIYNRAEADQIISLLKDISSDLKFVEGLAALIGADEAAIGVICMYAEQKKLLRQKFSEVMWEESFKRLVKIDTVDSYQGKENRVIILSLTRSHKDQKPGFLKAPNRINVAMSRAMDRLVIVGSTEMWNGLNKELPLGSVLKLMGENGDKQGYRFINAENGGKNK